MDKSERGPFLRKYIAYRLYNNTATYERALSLVDDIVCHKCKKTYIKELNKIDKHANLFMFFLDIHNNINKKKKKPVWSQSEYIDYIQNKKFLL